MTLFDISSVPKDVVDQMIAHSVEEAPKESCGLLVVKNGRYFYIKCKNMAAEPCEDFAISSDELIKAESVGALVASVHSHPYRQAKPSQADLVRCEETGVPWVIISYPNNNINVIEPSGYEAPLEGRDYHYGILDCYTIIKDYYKKYLNVLLPDFDRPENWWLRGMDMYMDNYKASGFVEIPQNEVKVHDVILFQHDSPVPNHSGIYVGDNRFLHHFMGRLSSRDVYDGYWRKIAVRFLRHGSLM